MSVSHCVYLSLMRGWPCAVDRTLESDHTLFSCPLFNSACLCLFHSLSLSLSVSLTLSLCLSVSLSLSPSLSFSLRQNLITNFACLSLILSLCHEKVTLCSFQDIRIQSLAISLASLLISVSVSLFDSHFFPAPPPFFPFLSNAHPPSSPISPYPWLSKLSLDSRVRCVPLGWQLRQWLWLQPIVDGALWPADWLRVQGRMVGDLLWPGPWWLRQWPLWGQLRVPQCARLLQVRVSDGLCNQFPECHHLWR